ncbi:ABC transporter transmembrane domain-containing protein, partial [Candidatus Symbiopectobacterium sp. NZEC135]
MSQDKYVWQGLASIVGYYGIAVNIEALQAQFGTDTHHDINVQLVRAARHCGFRCRYQARITVSDDMPTPALVYFPEKGYVLLLAVKEGKWLIQEISRDRSEIFHPAQGQTVSGFMFTRRFFSDNLAQKFNLRWFAQAFIRYKSLVVEIMLASFFIQILALILPLFFQIVVDKVLAHQSVSTLDVLALGMICVTLADVVLDGLRNYQLAHTSQRIDATLSSLLYRHLLSLPLGWFRGRQTGVTVARVHELKTVREFLTGSAMTLGLDLLFTVVFFVVMAMYSLSLTVVVLISLLPYIVLSAVITRPLRNRLEDQFRQGAKNQAFLVESITAIEPVKAMSVEHHLTRRWDEQTAAFVSSCFKTGNLSNIANQISRFISRITSVVILWYGSRLVIEGGMTVGGLIAFNMFAGHVTGPILRLVQLWQDV